MVIVDDLANGDAGRVAHLGLESFDLSAGSAVNRLEALLKSHAIEAVIHFAARKQVAESVDRPAWYFSQNVGSLTTVLQAMESTGVGILVFSSSAAVYGATEGDAISESDPTTPINPYGETKLVGEGLVAAASHAFGLRASSLRYFNVAGAGWPELGDHAVLNLLPMVFERIDAGQPPIIFGDDYATADGTCVRDYVHVLDLANAHIATLDHLTQGPAGHSVFNVGTGVGTSVRSIIETIKGISGVAYEPLIADRRAGDPAVVVASPERIASEIGWRSVYNVQEVVESAWSAHVEQLGR